MTSIAILILVCFSVVGWILEFRQMKKANEIQNRTLKILSHAEHPQLNNELLGYIGAEIILRTGDGPLAAYVVQWLSDRNI